MGVSPGSVRAGRAYIEISTDQSKLDKDLKTVREKLRSVGDSISNVGGQMMRIGSAITLPAFFAIKSFADFQDAMLATQAVTSGTASDMETLSKQARTLGMTTAYTAQQVSQGMAEMGRTGFKIPQIQVSIESMMNLVRATGSGMERLAEISQYAGAVMNSFSIPMEDAAHVADVLAFAANNSAMNIGDLGEAMKTLGSFSSRIGNTLEDTLADLMVLANAGVKGSLAGTSLRKVYSSLSAQAVRDELKNIGVNVIDADTGKMRKIADILIDIADATKGMQDWEKANLARTIFNERGMNAALNMLPRVDNLREKLNQLRKDTEGYAKKTAEMMESGLGGFLRGLISRVQELGLAIGESFQSLTANSPVAKGIYIALHAMIEFIKANQKAIAVIVSVSATLLALGTTIKIVGWAVSGLSAIVGVATAAMQVFHGVAVGITWLTSLGTMLMKVASMFAFSTSIMTTAGILPMLATATQATVAISGLFSVISGGVNVAAQGFQQLKDDFSATATSIREDLRGVGTAIMDAFSLGDTEKAIDLIHKTFSYVLDAGIVPELKAILMRIGTWFANTMYLLLFNMLITPLWESVRAVYDMAAGVAKFFKLDMPDMPSALEIQKDFLYVSNSQTDADIEKVRQEQREEHAGDLEEIRNLQKQIADEKFAASEKTGNTPAPGVQEETFNPGREMLNLREALLGANIHELDVISGFRAGDIVGKLGGGVAERTAKAAEEIAKVVKSIRDEIQNEEPGEIAEA